MSPNRLIAEVQNYKTAFERILSNFKKASESIDISPSDDPVYRQKVIEICDLLDDGLGRPNGYSGRVRDFYRLGLQNFLSSPSYKSVQDIIVVLGAVLTRVKRSPEIVRKSGETSDSSKPPAKRVFIGHGHSTAWKEIKDFLRDRLNLEYEEFNREPSAGLSNKERLQNQRTIFSAHERSTKRIAQT